MRYSVSVGYVTLHGSIARLERIARRARHLHPSPSPAPLFLWGCTDADGLLYIEPAFIVAAPPALPDSAGGCTLTSRDATGHDSFRFPSPCLWLPTPKTDPRVLPSPSPVRAAGWMVSAVLRVSISSFPLPG